jgi:hypothetical protein
VVLNPYNSKAIALNAFFLQHSKCFEGKSEDYNTNPKILNQHYSLDGL